MLKKASCARCADITTKFELKVARELWGDARIAFDAPSRRKTQRKKQLIMPDTSSRGRSLAIPVSEYPAVFVFYKMSKAGLLQGLPEDVDLSGAWQLVIIDDDKRREEFLTKYPGKKPILKFRNVPHDFGRLLAKIGYGHILTQIDPTDFNPICVPYILGQKTNVSYVVGGTFDEQAPVPDTGYLLETAGFGNADRILLVALVRLLANTHSPAYHVVVGEVVGADRVERVMRQLEVTVEEATIRKTGTQKSLPHWVPKVWPLPI